MDVLQRVLMTAALLWCVACTDGRSGINPGDRAPNVQGISPSGAPAALYEIKGKLFLLNFWATWCGPCIAEMPALQSLHAKFKDRGFQVVGIAVDDTEANVRETIQRFGITYPIIIDNKAQSKRAYQVKGFPESFILDEAQRVMVVSDPEDGTPQTRLWGPREWDSPRVGALINSMLK
jgi:peroxiredoxin